jgi:hypothetical protein
MNRLMIPAILYLTICPLLTAQQATQVPLTSATEQPAANKQGAADVLQPSAAAERNLAIKKARTIFISSETAYLTVSTLDRALLKQRDWEKLGLNIVETPGKADLQLNVDRLIFTHIHTYILTDKATGIVLASGRVRAFDGVVASSPMAEQIVKALSVARLPSSPVGSDQDF